MYIYIFSGCPEELTRALAAQGALKQSALPSALCLPWLGSEAEALSGLAALVSRLKQHGKQQLVIVAPAPAAAILDCATRWTALHNGSHHSRAGCVVEIQPVDCRLAAADGGRVLYEDYRVGVSRLAPGGLPSAECPFCGAASSPADGGGGKRRRVETARDDLCRGYVVDVKAMQGRVVCALDEATAAHVAAAPGWCQHRAGILCLSGTGDGSANASCTVRARVGVGVGVGVDDGEYCKVSMLSFSLCGRAGRTLQNAEVPQRRGYHTMWVAAPSQAMATAGVLTTQRRLGQLSAVLFPAYSKTVGGVCVELVCFGFKKNKDNKKEKLAFQSLFWSIGRLRLSRSRACDGSW